MRRPSEKSFKARALRMFHQSNPDLVGLTVEWDHYSPAESPRGEKLVCGSFIAKSPGFRPTRVSCTWFENGEFVVRPC